MWCIATERERKEIKLITFKSMQSYIYERLTRNGGSPARAYTRPVASTANCRLPRISSVKGIKSPVGSGLRTRQSSSMPESLERAGFTELCPSHCIRSQEEKMQLNGALTEWTRDPLLHQGTGRCHLSCIQGDGRGSPGGPRCCPSNGCAPPLRRAPPPCADRGTRPQFPLACAATGAQSFQHTR